MRNRLISLLLALASAAPALAQTQPACPETPAAPPPGFSGWATPTPMETRAATSAETASTAELIPGLATDLELAPTPNVTYPVRPEKPGAATSYGGLIAFRIETAGTYRVAIDAPAWIDVIAGDNALVSSGHGHGPACSGIRKIVDFKLSPGVHMLQVAGNPAAKVRLLVVAAR